METLRNDSKKTPCVFVMRGKQCKDGADKCHMGHSCPYGQDCEYGAACKFTLGEFANTGLNSLSRSADIGTHVFGDATHFHHSLSILIGSCHKRRRWNARRSGNSSLPAFRETSEHRSSSEHEKGWQARQPSESVNCRSESDLSGTRWQQCSCQQERFQAQLGRRGPLQESRG